MTSTETADERPELLAASLWHPERLTRLARVVAELQAVKDRPGLTEVVTTHLLEASGAAIASLSVVVDDHTLALVGLRGAPEGTAERWATYPLDESTPVGAALVTREAQLIVGRKAIRARFPDLPLTTDGERSMLSLPLIVGDALVGVVGLSFDGAIDMDESELEFYRLMSDACAQALNRIQAQQAAAERQAKLMFLANASAELADSLDYESTLKGVAQLAVPDLADWCAISLEQDGVLRTLAVAHSDPAKVALAEEFQERYPPDPDAPVGAYAVLRSGQSQLVADVTDEMLVAAAKDEEHLQMLRSLAMHSGLTVPLTARGRVLGTITWVNGETPRRFGPADVAFGEDFARRAGVAIDNALLHSELRQIAEQLQQAVAPPELPSAPGWQLTAAYSSAGTVSVGGDFYDAIDLNDGRIVLAIGDVMGRGVEAAAAMSQVRAALRSFVAVDPDPASVLRRLDTLYERFPSDQLVTVIVGLADASRDRVSLCAAGHPPPLVVHPDGSAELLDVSGQILGVDTAERWVTVVPLAPGQTLLMYTDGLVERRGEDIDAGQARLREAASLLAAGADRQALDELVTALRDPARDDDVAVLAARRLSP